MFMGAAVVGVVEVSGVIGTVVAAADGFIVVPMLTVVPCCIGDTDEAV